MSIESIKLFVTIHGMIADVTCQASFSNGESEHIDGIFLFPVDPDAALYHFEATVGGRKVVAACKEKGEHHVSILVYLYVQLSILLETALVHFTVI